MGNKLIEGGIHTFSKKLVDGASTDVEMSRNLVEIQLFVKATLDILDKRVDHCGLLRFKMRAFSIGCASQYVGDDEYSVGSDDLIIAHLLAQCLIYAVGEIVADVVEGGSLCVEKQGGAYFVTAESGEQVDDPFHKGGVHPENVSVVGVLHILRENRRVADARWDYNYIAGADLISF